MGAGLTYAIGPCPESAVVDGYVGGYRLGRGHVGHHCPGSCPRSDDGHSRQRSASSLGAQRVRLWGFRDQWAGIGRPSIVGSWSQGETCLRS